MLVSVSAMSCNTYKWQRKRYYQQDASKNWNNYKSEKKQITKNEEVNN
jgi:hypothetical protein